MERRDKRKNPEKGGRHQRESETLLNDVGEIAHDITKHEQTEEDLKENEEAYRAVVETTGTGYVIIDKEGRVLDANPEYARQTGHRTLEEISGENVIEWIAGYEKEKNAP
jgi:PAS domain-containing protein